MLRNKRDAMIEQLRLEIPTERLMAAMISVFQVRRERAGLDANNFGVSNPLQRLDEFMKSCSMRQLKLLRGIAKRMILEEVQEH